MTHDTAPDFTRPLTPREAASILADDLPLMSEAQLAALLTDIHLTAPSLLTEIIEPLAREELARRRATISASLP